MDQKGVAVAFLRGIMLLVVCGIVLYVTDLILYGKDVGLSTNLENEIENPAVQETLMTYKWFWNVIPIVIVIGVIIYILYSAIRREPYTVEA